MSLWYDVASCGIIGFRPFVLKIDVLKIFSQQVCVFVSSSSDENREMIYSYDIGRLIDIDARLRSIPIADRWPAYSPSNNMIYESEGCRADGGGAPAREIQRAQSRISSSTWWADG